MAYTPAPETQTYNTHRIPLAYDFDLRPGNVMNSPTALLWGQDAGMVNILPVKESEGKELIGVTRPALKGTTISGSTGIVRGMYIWQKRVAVQNYTVAQIYCFLVVDNKIWSTDSDPTVSANWTLVNTLTSQPTVTAPVRFTEFIDDVGTKKLVLVDGYEGFVYTSNAAGTKITDVDFPSPHIPFPVFLNGRLYLAKSVTGDIYCSDLNDPSAWTAGNYISTETYPDDIQALVKMDNYLLAIGMNGSEFFYDAANPTGSPLARYQGGVLPFGTLQPNSIAYNKDTVVLLANSGEGQAAFKVINGFKFSDLDSSNLLNAYTNRVNNPHPNGTGTYSIATDACRGYFFRHQGELYYGFHFDGVRTGSNQMCYIDGTVAYSFKTKAWTELQFGNSSSDRTTRRALPVNCSATPTTMSSTTYVAGTVDTYPFFAKLDDTSGYDSLTNYNTALDIYQEVRTPELDFGTSNRKNMHRVGLNLELGNTTAMVPTVYVSYNDQDYNDSTWSTYRSITLDTTNSEQYFPFITQLGNFRRRALRFVHVSGCVIRWKTAEIDINKGQV